MRGYDGLHDRLGNGNFLIRRGRDGLRLRRNAQLLAGDIADRRASLGDAGELTLHPAGQLVHPLGDFEGLGGRGLARLRAGLSLAAYRMTISHRRVPHLYMVVIRRPWRLILAADAASL